MQHCMQRELTAHTAGMHSLTAAKCCSLRTMLDSSPVSHSPLAIISPLTMSLEANRYCLKGSLSPDTRPCSPCRSSICVVAPGCCRCCTGGRQEVLQHGFPLRLARGTRKHHACVTAVQRFRAAGTLLPPAPRPAHLLRAGIWQPGHLQHARRPQRADTAAKPLLHGACLAQGRRRQCRVGRRPAKAGAGYLEGGQVKGRLRPGGSRLSCWQPCSLAQPLAHQHMVPLTSIGRKISTHSNTANAATFITTAFDGRGRRKRRLTKLPKVSRAASTMPLQVRANER